MLSIVGGLPGSGKSFFAANYLANLGVWDGIYNTYHFKNPILIFTNIDGFRLEHKTLDSCFQQYGGMEKFFTIPTFEKIRESYPNHRIVVIVDEAQRYFDLSFKNKDVEFFFEYHRHVGIDLFLLTNAIPKIKKTIVGLSENIVEAQPRSFGVPGVFRYKYKDIAGTFLRSKAIRAKPEVFSIYRSFTTDETEKPKNIILHWGIMLVVMVSVAGFGFKAFVGAYKDKGKKPVSITNSATAATIPKTAAIQKPVSSVRSPGAQPLPVVASLGPASPSLIPPLLPSPSSVNMWRSYPVQGVLNAGSKVRYLIHGSIIEAKNCRSFSRDLMTVEYYGPEIPERRAGRPGVMESPVIQQLAQNTPVDSKPAYEPLFMPDK